MSHEWNGTSGNRIDNAYKTYNYLQFDWTQDNIYNAYVPRASKPDHYFDGTVNKHL